MSLLLSVLKPGRPNFSSIKVTLLYWQLMKNGSMQ